jgi:hypothetical protein
LNRSFVSPADATPAAPLTASLVLSLVDILSAALFAASLVSFSRRRHARRGGHCIALFFLLTTPWPPGCSLHRSFLSLADVLHALSLAESLLSLTCRCLARGAAHCNSCFVLLSTSCPWRRSPHHLFPSLVDVLAAVPITESLVSCSCARLSHRVARCVDTFG